MKYISIDLEFTTFKESSIVEFAAIQDDLYGDIKNIKVYHKYVKRDKYIYDNEETQLLLSQSIKHISLNKNNVIHESLLAEDFKYWLVNTCGYTPTLPQDKIIINVAGKNFNHMDRRQLEGLVNWDNNIIIRSRVLDPSILYMNEKDEIIPSLSKCVARMNKELLLDNKKSVIYKPNHTAINDALAIVYLLKHKFNSTL